MSFLNSKARNRKHRSSKKSHNKKGEFSWMNDSANPAEPQSLDQKHHKLNAKIGVLEDFLAGHAMAALQKDQMRRDNILPPPETFIKKQSKKRMSALERRQQYAERNRGGLRFFSLFCLGCGIAWWLLKTGL